MLRLSAITSATKRSIPTSDARSAKLLEQARADPAALVLVGDRERGLGGDRVAEPHVAGDGDDVLAVFVGQALPSSAPRSTQSGSSSGSTSRGSSDGKPWKRR